MKLKIRLVGFVRSYFGTNAQLHQMPKLIFKSITTTTYDVRGHTKKNNARAYAHAIGCNVAVGKSDQIMCGQFRWAFFAGHDD